MARQYALGTGSGAVFLNDEGARQYAVSGIYVNATAPAVFAATTLEFGSASDAVSSQAIHNISLADQPTASDSVTAVWIGVAVVQDALSATDLLFARAILASGLIENAATSDGWSASVTLTKALAETAEFVDAVSTTLLGVGAVNEGGGATDTVTEIMRPRPSSDYIDFARRTLRI